MKQHITIRQLAELSQHQRDILAKWYAKQKYGQTNNSPITGNSVLLPKLSIGQMIEFLIDNANEMGLQFYDKTVEWQVWRGYYTAKLDEIIKDDLCDALWEACKEVLEK